MALIIFYAMEYKTDPSKQGVVRMCVFVLQTLSTEPNFGRLLNQDFETQDSLPSTIKLDNFHGTHGDFLIVVSHAHGAPYHSEADWEVHTYAYHIQQREAGRYISITFSHNKQHCPIRRTP